MKKNTGNKIKLGVFVTIGAILFMAAVFYIGQKQRLFSKTIQIKFMCTDVGGLQAGNNVRFSGIMVGTVQNIEIKTDTTVEVALQVDKDVKQFIKKDAKASIGSEGLMGDKVVNLSAGMGTQEVEDGDFIVCVEGSSMEEIMAEVKVVAANAAIITADLAGIIGDIRAGKGTIGKLLVDSTMGEDLDKSLSNIKEGTQGFKENMDAAQHNILLRGYFKKKEKEQEQQQKEKEKEQNKKR